MMRRINQTQHITFLAQAYDTLPWHDNAAAIEHKQQVPKERCGAYPGLLAIESTTTIRTLFCDPGPYCFKTASVLWTIWSCVSGKLNGISMYSTPSFLSQMYFLYR